MRPMAVVVKAILFDDDLQVATTPTWIRPRHWRRIVRTQRPANAFARIPRIGVRMILIPSERTTRRFPLSVRPAEAGREIDVAVRLGT